MHRSSKERIYTCLSTHRLHSSSEYQQQEDPRPQTPPAPGRDTGPALPSPVTDQTGSRAAAHAPRTATCTCLASASARKGGWQRKPAHGAQTLARPSASPSGSSRSAPGSQEEALTPY